MNLGTTGVAPPKAASSSTARYSRTAWPGSSGGSHSSPGVEFWRLASALIIEASTAKPSPPTNPSAIQRATVCSNSLRRRSLSRKRPCLFLEKVEWRSEEHTSELQSLMRISYAVFCLKKKKTQHSE